MRRALKLILALLFIPCFVVIGIGEVNLSTTYIKSNEGFGGLNSTDVVVADFDKDGYEDVFFTNAQGEQNRLFWGTSDNKVFTSSGLALGDLKSSSAAVADLDGDTFVDIVVTNELDDNAVTIWKNNGSRQFTRQDVSWDGASARKAVIADFDGENGNDILVCDANQSRILRNDGDGGFASDRFKTIGPAISSCVDAWAGSMDGDLYPDILLATQSDTFPSTLFLNDGTSFTNASTFPRGGNFPFLRVVVADLDKNSELDVLLATTNATTIWLNQGSRDAVSYEFEHIGDVANDATSDLVVANIDSDSYPDIFFANADVKRDTIWINQLNLENGTFEKSNVLFPLESSTAVAVGD